VSWERCGQKRFNGTSTAGIYTNHDNKAPAQRAESAARLRPDAAGVVRLLFVGFER
jgi:hypothetical protein